MSGYSPMIANLTRHRGVTACLLVMESDGILVEGTAQIGVDTSAFAALTASLYRKAAKAVEAAGFGSVGFFELEAEQGRVLAAGKHDLVVVVVAQSRVNVGLLRVDLLKAAAGL